jgi:hypothetical protein
MADNPDKNTPTRSSNMHKAEGERWTSDPDTVEVADRNAAGIGDTAEDTGGISNRPLSDEIKRQESLPPRRTSSKETASEDVAARTGRGDEPAPRNYDEKI